MKESIMQKNFVTVLIVLLFLPVFLFAQEKTGLKPKGVTVIHNKHIGNLENIPISKVKNLRSKQISSVTNKAFQSIIPLNPSNLVDTFYTVTDPYNINSYGSNFGFFGQDRMVQWFQAPADLILHEVWFALYSAYAPQANLEVKIVAYQPGITTGDLEFLTDDWAGWYEATGNGYHDATAFFDDPDRTGAWQSVNRNETFEHDIWSDGGVGKTITPSDYSTDSVTVTFTHVDLADLGYPDIPAGTIFGIAVKNLAPALNASRVGFRGTTVGTTGANQYSLFKYYADANTNAGQCPTLDCYGWWIRDETLSFGAMVEIYGDPPPTVNSWTTIPSDVELGPFTIDANITDTNPSGGGVGVDSAIVQYSIDAGATWNNVMMTGSMPNFTGDIPAQSSEITVMYRIRAVDVSGNATTTITRSFYIFQPSGANTLVIYNGFNSLTGEPQDDYFGPNVEFDHDSWNYGTVSAALLNNYTNVLEIWNENNGVYNDDIVRPWLEADGSRNYLLAGQEWLGAKNSYVDSDYVAGDFEYDILGVDSGYNDISYYFPNATSSNSIGDSLPTLITPQPGTIFGQPLVDLVGSITPAPDSLMYNPVFVSGNFYATPNLNWQDGFVVVPGSGTDVDAWVETRGTGVHITEVQMTLATLCHRTLTAGNKIVFAAFDPISLTTANDDSYPYYYWVGNDTSNVVYQALKWFEVVTDVNENGGTTPKEFSLSQNYPNPFNPATTIKYSIPNSSKVTLKVYDILGKEVASLVNETKNTGNYEVSFDASKFASGMYIYTITAGNFTASKKMMLLK
jgi:Secretion system C-terminal sorting domain